MTTRRTGSIDGIVAQNKPLDHIAGMTALSHTIGPRGPARCRDHPAINSTRASVRLGALQEVNCGTRLGTFFRNRGCLVELLHS